MRGFSLCALLAFFAPCSSGDESCQGPRPGDCDPVACGGTCEARYIRFYDSDLKGDRTAKSCHCSADRMCVFMGLSAFAGCRNYASLSTAGQRLVRTWSINAFDRRSSLANQARFAGRYSDRQRHAQLMAANTLFCCRTTFAPFRAARLRTTRASASAVHLFVPVLLTLLALL